MTEPEQLTSPPAPAALLAELRAAVEAGERRKYLFFWGHTPSRDDRITAACLSQWYDAGFELEGCRYRTAEHYMMAEKARLFENMDALCDILAAPHPSEAKRLGRELRRFDQATWERERFGVVVRGNLAKFEQHPALGQFLLGTGDRVLVEASPQDAIWGIGLARNHPDAAEPRRWPGLNLLGFALMVVRDALAF
jgi:ribA/ribD-fused uncharacterized protein